MYRLCGDVADGIHVHPFHSVRYLRETALPALDEGLARSGRTRADVALAAPIFCVVGGDERARRFARGQIGFYASTKLYRPVLEVHGAGDLQERLARLVAVGDFARVGDAVGDELLAELVIEADSWPDAAAAIRERYDGVLDRVSLYSPPNPPQGEELTRFLAVLKE
jgi:alkanesulfonate monooxygenase SsuD/methylene tetrahydromethanopterin reductase-like flavin-dependent oxidoreductase (luciferase family)